MTLYHEGLDEIYHSRRGALTESMHVFIEQGLRKELGSPLNILELGFGTGLNAWLSSRERKPAQEIRYTAYETHPVSEDLWMHLDYCDSADAEQFASLHRAAWGSFQETAHGFYLRKLNETILNIVDKNQYDLIYFDAFSPEKQPDLWTHEVFLKMYLALKPGGRLLTYCSKSLVRRNMLASGFEVIKRPGPPGKREMLEGIKG